MDLRRLYERKIFIDKKIDQEIEEKFSEKRSYYFSNCKDLEYVLDGTITNIVFENCQNCSVIVDNIFAKIEILRCSDIYLGVSKDSDTSITIQVDLSHDIEIELEHPSMIQTVSCMDIIVNEMTLPCSIWGMHPLPQMQLRDSSDYCHYFQPKLPQHKRV